MRRQAIADELTGLVTHGQVRELLNAEIERVGRYHPIGLTMLEVDDLTPSTTYAHVPGDAVLRHLARVLQENSRDADSPARYGGEELSPMLPHTDVDGADAIGERIRTTVEGLRVPITDGQSVLRITASLGSPTRLTDTSRC